ncbi:MAG: hypothetical protein KGR26_15375 [Cyanobacteria bacterium REEB65]|nr:hypothetical protein [Cyanobacteria bacterium REEB65]
MKSLFRLFLLLGTLAVVAACDAPGFLQTGPSPSPGATGSVAPATVFFR